MRFWNPTPASGPVAGPVGDLVRFELRESGDEATELTVHVLFKAFQETTLFTCKVCALFCGKCDSGETSRNVQSVVPSDVQCMCLDQPAMTQSYMR